MPIEGISYTNAAIYKMTTSEEVAQQAEHNAQVKADTMIKKVDESDATKLDLSDESKQDKTSYEGRDTHQEGKEETLESKKTNFQKYKVTFNSISDKVELIDRETGALIETIKPDELLALLAKSKNASGVLVDKQV